MTDEPAELVVLDPEPDDIPALPDTDPVPEGEPA